jgi:hypothetical protein
MPNGQIMYWDDDVYALLGKKLVKENWTVAYCRVAGTTESGPGMGKRVQETPAGGHATCDVSYKKHILNCKIRRPSLRSPILGIQELARVN